jgi:hypothetical protein
MPAYAGDAANAHVTLYRQRIGLLAAQATAASLASQETHDLQHQDSWQCSLPSLQLAAHLFENGGRHPRFVPRDLVVDESMACDGEGGNGRSALLPDPLPSETENILSTTQSGQGTTSISYLPCCTTCGGILQPGDCLSTASVRLVRFPPISRTRRRKLSRARCLAKQRVKQQGAVDAPSASNRLLPIVTSPSLIDTSTYKNCVELTCRICQSTLYVAGVERNPHPLRKPRPQAPTQQSQALQRTNSIANTKRDARSFGQKKQVEKATSDDRKRKPPSPATASNLASEDFISLGNPRSPLPQRVQPSNRSKKKKSNKGGSLMNFLSSLND